MKSRKSKMLILSVLCLMIILGAVSCATLYTMIRNNTMQIYKTEAAVKNEAVRGEQEIALRTLYEKIGADVTVLSQSIISRNGVVPFIEGIEALGKKANVGLSIDSVNVVSGAKDVATEHVELTVTTQGSWNSTQRFLRMLERMPYKLFVKSASLSHGAFSENRDKAVSEVNVWKSTFVVNIVKQK